MKNSRIESVRKEFSLFGLQDLTLTLAGMERKSSYCDFDASTRFCMDALRKAGFSRVERIAHKADGQTAALDCIMPEAWDQTGHSFLKIVSPDVPEYDRMLADSDRHPQEALIWSAPTPPGGIDCEIVDHAALDPEHPDVEGKWVLLQGSGVSIPGVPYRRLAEAGAAGLAVYNLETLKSAPDDAVWFDGQGFNSWFHEKEAPRLPAFSVPPRQAVKLLELLKQGPVKVHAEMRSRIYDGEIYTVTAVIPGETEEEYALFAHMYEPFVADDALGFGFVCEFGRQLIRRKVKLRKTLRVVLSMELYGFSAWLAVPENRRRIQAAMSVDTLNRRDGSIAFRLSPVFLPFFGDWFYRDWFRKYLPEFRWMETPGSLSDDTFSGDPAIGIPVNWVVSPPDIYHHNTSAFFAPNWEKTEELFPVLAGALEAMLVLDLPGNYSRRAVREFNTAADVILKDPDLRNYEKKLLLDTEFSRYEGMLRSRDEFAGGETDCQPLKNAYLTLKKRIGPVRTDRFSSIEQAAMDTVPERLVPEAPFSLSRVPYRERRNHLITRPLWALFDGRRNLLDCIRILDHEFGTKASPKRIERCRNDLLYLEKYGYVRLHPAAARLGA